MSPHTAESYASDLHQWLRFCEGLGRPPYPPAPDDVAAFRLGLASEGKARSTQQRAVAALRSWMRFVEMEEGGEEDLPLPELLTGAEVKSLRSRAGSLVGSYVQILAEGVVLLGAQISPYPYADNRDYDPRSTRKLLYSKFRKLYVFYIWRAFLHKKDCVIKK